MIQITKIVRGYGSEKARLIAIHQLTKRGFNYFVPFRDTQSEFALLYGTSETIAPPYVYVDGGYAVNNMGRRRKTPLCPNPQTSVNKVPPCFSFDRTVERRRPS